jgi:hypothetical protein
LFMRHEHVTDARDIERVISFFFETVDVRRHPRPLFELSPYTLVRTEGPRRNSRATCSFSARARGARRP